MTYLLNIAAWFTALGLVLENRNATKHASGPVVGTPTLPTNLSDFARK